MSDDIELLGDAVSRLLARSTAHRAEVHLETVWDHLSDAGFVGIGGPETDGSLGGTLVDAAAVVRTCARFAAVSRLPIGATLLVGHWLRSRVGLPPTIAPTAIAPKTALRLTPVEGGFDISGVASRIAGGQLATDYLLVAEDAAGVEYVVSLTIGSERSRVTVEADPSRHPVALDKITLDRARVTSDAVRILPIATRRQLQLRVGLLATVHIAGLLDEVFDLTRGYTQQREQFSRHIADFQMVKDMLALLAGEVAAASAASDGAVDAASSSTIDELALRAARLRAGRSAGAAARLAHQIHGTIGMTAEYRLHAYTSQLWYWRDAECPEYEGQRQLGGLLAARGADNFWLAIVGE
jgi:alkylation response protein AidB-like acyl-CoA dehydrogenase